MRQRIISAIIGSIMRLLPTAGKRWDNERLQRMEFNSSTQRIGFRFTEKMRDHWRRRWLKIKR